MRMDKRPAGFGIFRQFGVMTDEVEQIMPETLSVGAKCDRTVNYALLGIARH